MTPMDKKVEMKRANLGVYYILPIGVTIYKGSKYF